jgi:hypothetical protein
VEDGLLDACRAYVRNLAGNLDASVLLYDTDHGAVPIRLDAATPLACALAQAAQVGCRSVLLITPGSRPGEILVVDDRARRAYHRFLDDSWVTFRPAVANDGIERLRVPEVQDA